MKLSIKLVTPTIAILGLVGATGFFWHSMRDVWEMASSQSVDTYHSQISEAQKLESLIREGDINGALSRLQRNRDLAIIQLGHIKPNIDVSTWRWSRKQFVIDKLDSAIIGEVEYRRIYGQTNSKIAEQARSVLTAYDN